MDESSNMAVRGLLLVRRLSGLGHRPFKVAHFRFCLILITTVLRLTKLERLNFGLSRPKNVPEWILISSTSPIRKVNTT